MDNNNDVTYETTQNFRNGKLVPGAIVATVTHPCGCKVTGTDNYGVEWCEKHWEQVQPKVDDEDGEAHYDTAV